MLSTGLVFCVSCSQQIRFGLQNPQDIISCGVFNVYERSLYKMPERIPHPNGVLDQRLVSLDAHCSRQLLVMATLI